MKDRKKNRLDSFHYNSGYFFVTINTKDNKKIFGEVIKDEMVLNEYGKVVEKYLLRISEIYADSYVWNFVIMPNHIHTILILDNLNTSFVGEDSIFPNNKNGSLLSSPTNKVSKIVKGFKQITWKVIRNEMWLKTFQRQKSFYDHIIRNEEDINRIVEYIQFNPYKRENDEYYI